MARRLGNDSYARSQRRRGRRSLMVVSIFLLVMVTVAGTGIWLASGSQTAGPDRQEISSSQNDKKPEGPESSSQKPEDQQPVDPQAEALRQAQALAEQNCTGAAPQLNDPANWEKDAKELLQRLIEDPAYAEMGMTLSARENFPYLIAVNRAASTVTVFKADSEGQYSIPYQAMVCSGGSDTPLGYWHAPVRYDWRLLYGPCYGQYATRIWDSYLFHSVPYYSQHKDDLEYDEFNKLGTLASLGCIRLQVVDVKWIFDNCPLETPVVIYDDADNPGPMGKPGTIATDPADTEKRGWDPTDPDPANPWDDKFRSGTAIRSEEAWEDYHAAVESGEFDVTVTPTDLQGWSTDSAQVGTRG